MRWPFFFPLAMCFLGILSLLQAVYRLVCRILIWGGPSGKRPKETGKRDSLLQLPVELIHRISNELPPASRLVLSQSCRPLHKILSKDVSATRLSREDRFEYLAAIARQRPECWVCDACFAFHRVDITDTPENPCVQSCPAGIMRWRRTGYAKRDRLDPRVLRLDHRHVQLALKYTRLRCRNYKDYLKKLLAPCVDSNFETYLWPYRQPNNLAVRYSAYPKIVMGDDGNLRFLLFSIWQYQPDKKSLSLAAMGDLKVCPHLMLCYGAKKGAGLEIGSLRRILEVYVQGGGNANRKGLYYCCYCPTDLCVETSSGRLTLSVWQDLGPEGSPIDKTWRVHVLTSATSPRGHPHLSHEAGSVLDLYEKPEVGIT